MPEELIPRTNDDGPTAEAINRNPQQYVETFDHLTNEQLKKRWNITIEPLDRGCIVVIGCKRIAFEKYEDAIANISLFYSSPRIVIEEWRGILGV